MQVNIEDIPNDPVIEDQQFVCITYIPHPEHNTIYFKIRGSFPTIHEAQERAKALSATDPLFPIYVAPVGALLPAQSHMINLEHLSNHENNSAPNVSFNIIAEEQTIPQEQQPQEESQEGQPQPQEAPQEEQPQEEQPQEKQEEKDYTCLACLENPRNSLILPCRHQVYCLQCSNLHVEKSNTCPICRRKISEIINIFIA